MFNKHDQNVPHKVPHKVYNQIPKEKVVEEEYSKAHLVKLYQGKIRRRMLQVIEGKQLTDHEIDQKIGKMSTRSMTCFTYRHDDPQRQQQKQKPVMEEEIIQDYETAR